MLVDYLAFLKPKYFVLLEVYFQLNLISLLSKSVLLTKLACVNLVASSRVVIYLEWSGILSLTSLIFVSSTVVVTKPLVSDIFINIFHFSSKFNLFT